MRVKPSKGQSRKRRQCTTIKVKMGRSVLRARPIDAQTKMYECLRVIRWNPNLPTVIQHFIMSDRRVEGIPDTAAGCADCIREYDEGYSR